MKIGLLSDTHGHLPESVFKHFEHCDEIWHAGDFGAIEVADKITAFKPLRGVYGNIDDVKIQTRFPENLLFGVDGLKVFITHIAGTPGKFSARVKKILNENQPDLLICGHSHILKVLRDPEFNLMYMNPGAAGNEGFHKVKTLLRFDVVKGKLNNLEVIELGKRGS